MRDLSELLLFSGIPDPECLRMAQCFEAPVKSFSPGEIAYSYGTEKRCIGVLEQGQAQLVKIDAFGARSLLERLSEGDAFGEPIAFSSQPYDSVSVECESSCRILFLPWEKLTKPCKNACECHQALIGNLFSLLSQKARSLSERVEVLSCRCIREKLLCYFRILSSQSGEGLFTLPFTLSALADFLCCDRSAMMRELKKLKESGVLLPAGKNAYFLRSPA